MFINGQMGEAPDHLQVVTDRTYTWSEGGCSRARKDIEYQLVDANNRPAARVSIDEKPFTVKDTCSNHYVGYSACSDLGVDSSGRFVDGLRTGCPNANTSPTCDFSLTNHWRWCKWGGPHYYDNKVLAAMIYDVRRTYVKVDGQADITDGAHKFP